MRRYYFDSIDGEAVSEDMEGCEFSDILSARDGALAALPGLISETLPEGDFRQIGIALRDDTGVRRYTATVTLHGVWETSGRPARSDANSGLGSAWLEQDNDHQGRAPPI